MRRYANCAGFPGIIVQTISGMSMQYKYRRKASNFDFINALRDVIGLDPISQGSYHRAKMRRMVASRAAPPDQEQRRPAYTEKAPDHEPQ